MIIILHLFQAACLALQFKPYYIYYLNFKTFIWQVSGRCPVAVWRVSERCLEGVLRVSEGNLWDV